MSKTNGSNLNPTEMYGRVEEITPERAAAWLESMPPNRNHRPSRVRRYCDTHLRGDWVLTHQGIAIDCHDHLRDGQHRLRMIVQTGKPAVLFVVYNVPDTAFLHMDEQLPRSTRDALLAAEKGDFTCSMIATAALLECVPTIAGQHLTRDRDEVLSLLRNHSGKLSFVEERLEAILGATRAVRVLVARAWSHCQSDLDRLNEWCEVIKTGIGDPSADTAAVVYRNLLLRLGRNNGQSVEEEKYKKGQAALQCFLSRRPMEKVYGSDKDLFPLMPETSDDA